MDRAHCAMNVRLQFWRVKRKILVLRISRHPVIEYSPRACNLLGLRKAGCGAQCQIETRCVYEFELHWAKGNFVSDF